jgi:hypothetical protein
MSVSSLSAAGRVAFQAEAANVGIERLRLFHVADVAGVGDDRELGGRNGGVELQSQRNP